MPIKFEIETITRSGNGKECYVFAKCLEPEKVILFTGQSSLGNIDIIKYPTQPRAVDQDGNLRFDLYLFQIRHKKDYDKLVAGEIVELID